MYLTDATYTIRDRLRSTSLWNTIRSGLNPICGAVHMEIVLKSAEGIIGR